MIGGLIVAVGFLTRIPVPARAFDAGRARTQSLAWYPLVGALVGLLLCALAWLLPTAKPLLGAAVVLVAWVALTGALHLDGLADSADAWIGGMAGGWEQRRARTLEIMKDPRSGPAGVTAVVLVLLLKFAALASVWDSAWTWLWIAPLLARMAATAAFVSTPYVRAGGLGSGLADAPRIACAIALLLGALTCGLAGWAGAVAFAMALAAFVLWRRACLRRLGGFTGDTAGALVELVETGVLVALALYPGAQLSS